MTLKVLDSPLARFIVSSVGVTLTGSEVADTVHVQKFEPVPFSFCASTLIVCVPWVAGPLVYDDSVTEVVSVIFVLMGVSSKYQVIFEGWLTVAVNVLDSPTLLLTSCDEGSDKVITGPTAFPSTFQAAICPNSPTLAVT